MLLIGCGSMPLIGAFGIAIIAAGWLPGCTTGASRNNFVVVAARTGAARDAPTPYSTLKRYVLVS